MGAGWITLFRGRQITVRMHWTAPVGAFIIGRFRFVPGIWLGFFFVVLVHELGHAIVVRACGARVRYADLHGAGGECSWSGTVTAWGRALIAWGGVAAQVVLYAIVMAWLLVAKPTFGEFGEQVVEALTGINLFMAAFNLLPVRSLDGVEAWKILPMVWRRVKNRRKAADAAKRTDARLRAAVEVARLREAEEGEQARSDGEDATDDAVDDVVNRLIDRTTRKKKDKGELP
jgi:Zn-dependent protease